MRRAGMLCFVVIGRMRFCQTKYYSLYDLRRMIQALLAVEKFSYDQHIDRAMCSRPKLHSQTQSKFRRGKYSNVAAKLIRGVGPRPKTDEPL